MQTYIKKNYSVGKCWGLVGKRQDIGHYVRSKIEANFCRMLKLNNIRYRYEPEIFKKFNIYIPDIELLDDFYLWKSGTYIELKHLIDKSGIEKLRVFSLQYPEKKICVLEKRSLEWKYLERLNKLKLPLWETGKQNIRVTPELYK